MLELLLACGNELVEARPPAWWELSPETTLGVVVGLGGPAAALTGLTIHRWARATTGLQRAAVLTVGAAVGLGLALTALFAAELPPLAFAPPAAALLLARLRALWSPGDARVETYPRVQAASACSG